MSYHTELFLGQQWALYLVIIPINTMPCLHPHHRSLGYNTGLTATLIIAASQRKEKEKKEEFECKLLTQPISSSIFVKSLLTKNCSTHQITLTANVNVMSAGLLGPQLVPGQ